MKFTLLAACAFATVATNLENAAKDIIRNAEHTANPLSHGVSPIHVNQLHASALHPEIHAPVARSEVRARPINRKPKGYPLVDPVYEGEHVAVTCTTCLPRTGQFLDTPFQIRRTWKAYRVDGLSPRSLNFLVQNMQSTIDKTTVHLAKLTRAKELLVEVEGTDPISPFLVLIEPWLDDDLVAWSKIKVAAQKYLDQAAIGSTKKDLYTSEFKALVKTKRKENQKPLLRPPTLSFELGEDVIQSIRGKIQVIRQSN